MRPRQDGGIEIGQIGRQQTPVVNRRIPLWAEIVDLRREQLGGFARNWITRGRAQDREHGHRGADTDADCDDHERRKYNVALQAAQRQIEVVTEHDTPARSMIEPPNGNVHLS